jgi:hypothetical protein
VYDGWRGILRVTRLGVARVGVRRVAVRVTRFGVARIGVRED